MSNAAAGWRLPPLAADHHYTTSYRVTARFFLWLDTRIKPGLIKTLDAAMRAHRYQPALWAAETGQTIDQLWSAYVADPAVAEPNQPASARRAGGLDQSATTAASL